MCAIDIPKTLSSHMSLQGIRWQTTPTQGFMLTLHPKITAPRPSGMLQPHNTQTSIMYKNAHCLIGGNRFMVLPDTIYLAALLPHISRLETIKSRLKFHSD